MDTTEAITARDAALAAVERGAPAGWLHLAGEAIREVAATGRPFTTDTIWDRVGKPPEPRAMGAAIRAAMKAGLIEATGGYEQSSRPEAHARPVKVWRGTAEASHGDRLF